MASWSSRRETIGSSRKSRTRKAMLISGPLRVPAGLFEGFHSVKLKYR